MTDIHIERNHELGIKEARGRTETFAQSLKEELQIDYEWNGNRLEFERIGATGALEVSADSVVVDVTLGAILSFMAKTIEDQINKALDRALE